MKKIMIFASLLLSSVAHANPTGAGFIYEIKTESNVNGLLVRHHPAANLRINPFGCSRNDYYLLQKTHAQFNEMKEMLLAAFPMSPTNLQHSMIVTLSNTCSGGFPVVANLSIVKS